MGNAKSIVGQVKADLAKLADSQQAAFLPRFFKAGKGEYAEGDRFIGVSVPNQRLLAKKYYQSCGLSDIQILLNSPIHELRSTGLFMLVYQYQRAKSAAVQEAIVQFYLANTNRVNNWDLVDSSAYHILGHYLLPKDRSILYQLSKSSNLWEQRIAIIATKYFISQGEFADTLQLAKALLNHQHDLIHKAVGWMLREVGKQDEAVLIRFLDQYYQQMPRTMLRYAIEKFPQSRRQAYLQASS